MLLKIPVAVEGRRGRGGKRERGCGLFCFGSIGLWTVWTCKFIYILHAQYSDLVLAFALTLSVHVADYYGDMIGGLFWGMAYSRLAPCSCSLG